MKEESGIPKQESAGEEFVKWAIKNIRIKEVYDQFDFANDATDFNTMRQSIVNKINKICTERMALPPSSPVGEAKRIKPEGSYFVGLCGKCGFKAASSEWGGGHAIADTGDYSDPVCPVCGSHDLEEADDNIWVDQKELFLKTIAALEDKYWHVCHRHLTEPATKTERPGEISSVLFSREQVKNILMEFSYDLQQGKYGGCSTHKHTVSEFVKAHPELIPAAPVKAFDLENTATLNAIASKMFGPKEQGEQKDTDQYFRCKEPWPRCPAQCPECKETSAPEVKEEKEKCVCVEKIGDNAGCTHPNCSRYSTAERVPIIIETKTGSLDEWSMQHDEYCKYHKIGAYAEPNEAKAAPVKEQPEQKEGLIIFLDWFLVNYMGSKGVTKNSTPIVVDKFLESISKQQ